MKPGSNDQMKGAVKAKAGQLANNPNLTTEGQNEKLAGKVQKKVGQIEKVKIPARCGFRSEERNNLPC